MFGFADLFWFGFCLFGLLVLFCFDCVWLVVMTVYFGFWSLFVVYLFVVNLCFLVSGLLI